jgi:superfamily I DNA/RNA helicase
VTLLEAHDNSSEASAIVEHLQELQERGYRWKEMAVLARTRAQVRTHADSKGSGWCTGLQLVATHIDAHVL